MCCFVEVAMTIYGLIALVQGEVPTSPSTYVRGIPAYLIGVLLLLTLPLAFGVRFVLYLILDGGSLTLTPQQTELLTTLFWFADFFVVAGVLLAAYFIATLNLGGGIHIPVAASSPAPVSREERYQPSPRSAPQEDLPTIPFDDT